MEATKEDLEIKIANEKIAKPRISPEFVTFWLHKFRKLDVRQQSHRKMLIDAFVNAIYLYDDKMVITFNCKDGTRTIALDDVKEAVKKNTGSDLDCLAAPLPKVLGFLRILGVFFCQRQLSIRHDCEGILSVFLSLFVFILVHTKKLGIYLCQCRCFSVTELVCIHQRRRELRMT